MDKKKYEEALARAVDDYVWDTDPYYRESETGKHFFTLDDLKEAFRAGAKWQKEEEK